MHTAQTVALQALVVDVAEESQMLTSVQTLFVPVPEMADLEGLLPVESQEFPPGASGQSLAHFQQPSSPPVAARSLDLYRQPGLVSVAALLQLHLAWLLFEPGLLPRPSLHFQAW